MPSPMVYDISAEMAEIEDMGESHIAVVWDFKSAHRIVQVHPDDWGLQACTLADLRGVTPVADTPVVLNTVVTFGFSTAGHWWGRLAAMTTRGAHYALGSGLKAWLLLFEDDGKMLMPLSKYR